jgi:hypothetical protein
MSALRDIHRLACGLAASKLAYQRPGTLLR